MCKCNRRAFPFISKLFISAGSPQRKRPVSADSKKSLLTVTNDFPCCLCPQFLAEGQCDAKKCPHLHFKSAKDAQQIGYRLNKLIVVGWENDELESPCRPCQPSRRNSRHGSSSQGNAHVTKSQEPHNQKTNRRDPPICHDFRLGRCTRGDACKYLHIDSGNPPNKKKNQRGRKYSLCLCLSIFPIRFLILQSESNVLLRFIMILLFPCSSVL